MPQGGDVLVEVDGETIANADDVAAAIADNSPGDEIEVVYYRDGERETAQVELGERPTRSRPSRHRSSPRRTTRAACSRSRSRSGRRGLRP